MPSLGKKYPVEIEITAKPKAEYETDAYFALDLPVAPAIMVGAEIVVEGTDVSDHDVECASAGLTAGMYAMRAALKTVLIERSVFGGQVAITKEVENYPGIMEIGGFELCEKFLQHAKAYNLEILEKEVSATEPGVACHAVRLADGTVLQAHPFDEAH